MECPTPHSPPLRTGDSVKHYMSLAEGPFEALKSGPKRIELRLLDEKRRQLSFGDIIIFSKLPDRAESIAVKVIGLSRAKRFEQIIRMVDPINMGFERGTAVEDMCKQMRRYYSKKEEESNGVLGIHICQL